MKREPQRLWPIWLSVSEASRALGIARPVLYSWVRLGLPVYKCGVRRKILVEDLVRYIRANLKTVEPPK
jgi:excisionase family DNA binding protein